MLQAIVILFYILIFSACVYRIPQFGLKGISSSKRIGLFLLKVVAGLLYVWISKHVIEGGDIFRYYADSQVVYRHLTTGEFYTFLQLTFGVNNGVITPNIAESVHLMGYWYDTSAYMVVRLNTLINVLTLGSGIYANAVFFAWLSFVASVLLAKLYESKLDAKKHVLYAIFLMPSLWFWTSGMHKESVCVFLITIVLYGFLKRNTGNQIIRVFLGATAFALLFFTRSFVAAMLMPPLIAYLLVSWKKERAPLSVYALVFGVLLIATYLIPKIANTPNMVDAVIEKKVMYEALDYGETAIELGEYNHSYLGILSVLPQALFNSLVRPHFLDVNSFLLGLASLESLFIAICLVVSLFYIKNCTNEQKNVLFLFLSFSLSYLLITGLIVPNLGAILRYRSVALFFLVPSLIYMIDKKDEWSV